jgi:hypothetical protein
MRVGPMQGRRNQLPGQWQSREREGQRSSQTHSLRRWRGAKEHVGRLHLPIPLLQKDFATAMYHLRTRDV